ncbi:MAG: hypothetical protein ACLUHK_03990 [Eubacteriales bacterium]
MGRKKRNIFAKKKSCRKKIRTSIINATMQVFGTLDNISAITDEILKILAMRMQDKSHLTILTNERDEIKRSLANILKAVEQSIFNATTKNCMGELKSQLFEIDDKIIIEQYKAQNQLKKEEVVEYLTHTIRQSPRLLIKILYRNL